MFEWLIDWLIIQVTLACWFAYLGSWLEQVQYLHQYTPGLLLADHVTAVLPTTHAHLDKTVVAFAVYVEVVHKAYP